MTKISLFLAHGAGAGHSSPFLDQFAATLCRRPEWLLHPVTFEYMRHIQETGKKRPPPKVDRLVEEYKGEIAGCGKTLIGGKSLGGRVATQLTDDPNVIGVVCFGFPFHPPGKPEKHRLSWLESLTKPCLIFQGTRDPFGNREWVSQQSLPDLVKLVWVEGADHDFRISKRALAGQQNWMERMTDTMTEWFARIDLK